MSASPVITSPTVAVIGGGYAGMAAAVTLANANIRTTVYETARDPGGRARRISYRETNLDNGQHILIGAYRELLTLMQLVGVPDTSYVRQRINLRVLPDFRLRAPRLPPPLDMAWALLTASGLTWRDRWAAVRFMQRLPSAEIADETTVAELYTSFEQPPTLAAKLWTPLCIAALNTAPQRASAKVFARVLQDALLGAPGNSDLILPRVDLSELFPLPASRWLAEKGSAVLLGARVTTIALSGKQIALSYEQDRQEKSDSFDAVICAAGPHQLDTLATDSEALRMALDPPRVARYEPIYTVYLQYPHAVALETPMLGQESGIAQWFFDRESLCGQTGLIAAVISASGPHETMDHDAIAAEAHRELAALVGGLSPPLWSKVVAEKFATMACEPGLLRPPAATAVRGLYLAGDYTAGDYPSTLEGAVRSGQQAARLLLETHQT